MRLTNGREETNFVTFTITSVDLKIHKTKTRKIKLINKCISLSFRYFDSQDPFLYILGVDPRYARGYFDFQNINYISIIFGRCIMNNNKILNCMFV